MATARVFGRLVCKCDVKGCGVVWIARSGEMPSRCANISQRHRTWDQLVDGSQGRYEQPRLSEPEASVSEKRLTPAISRRVVQRYIETRLDDSEEFKQ